MSADGDKLRDAAHRLEAIAEKASPNICPQWTYSAVRHIARNCDIECYHQGQAEEGLDHDGWDRYDDSPWITAMGAQVAAPLALMLQHAAAAADTGTSGRPTPLARSALALVEAIAWPVADGAS